MKFITALFATLLSMSAHASQTVTLGDASCTNRVCTAVPNSAAADITVYASAQYSSVSVIINGKTYSGRGDVSGDFAGLIATATDGSWLTVSTTWRTWTTQVNSGRAHYTLQHWELLDGEVVLP